MGWLRRIVVAVALAAFGAAVLLSQAPDVLEPAVDLAELEAVIGAEGQYAIVAACGVLAVAVAFWKGVSASISQPEPLSATDDSTVEEESLAGASFDEAVTTVTDGGWEDRRESARERVHDRLSEVAVERIATADGVDRDRARERIDGGEWTDDRVVTSFLGDETAPDAPLVWRLYEWLYEDRAYRRSVDRTIEAIDAYDGDRR